VSTHKVEIVRISAVEPHPNADRLEMARVYGYTCIIKKGDFQAGDLAVYIEPDYVVPDTAPFAFLKGSLRIKSRRLRGVWSQGLLMPLNIVPLDSDGYVYLPREGDDVMALLGIERYVPPADREAKPRPGKLGSPAFEKAPKAFGPYGKYELENWRRHQSSLWAGETVYVTEKIHGTNARYRWHGGRLWAGPSSAS
jgi:RNA ligase (TIGR02306 family)